MITSFNYRDTKLSLMLLACCSTGVAHANDIDYHLSGVLKFDETLYMASYADKGADFASGSNIREASLSVDGNITPVWSYHFEAGFEGSSIDVPFAFITYKGFSDSTQLSIGQVPLPFCIETSTSGKWIPFMERSLVAQTFTPCPGLGVNGSYTAEHFSGTVAITQPKHNMSVTGSDKIGTAVKLNFAPIKEDGRVLHFGLQGNHQETKALLNGVANPSSVAFSTRPEARSRNTAQLINTGGITARNYRVGEVELSGQWGPMVVETEYVTAKVRRPDADSVSLHGYNAQVSYVLTGETRPYNIQYGSFGQIKPSSANGAWEIATRYGYVNLNDRDISGGSENNWTLGLSWYINNNLRVTSNYIRAILNVPNAAKRHLDIFGMRFQVVW